MPFIVVFRIVFFAALAFVIGRYALRGLLNGRILLGIKGGRENWADRKLTPTLFWFWVVNVAFAALVSLLCGLAPLWGAG